jgi:hypothetical protein
VIIRIAKSLFLNFETFRDRLCCRNSVRSSGAHVGFALCVNAKQDDSLGGFCTGPRMFELRVAERILRLIRFRVPTIPTQPRTVILLVQRSWVRGAMAFNARTHWHSYLALFAHGSILHLHGVCSGNSQQRAARRFLR